MKKQDIFKEVATEQGLTTKEVTQIGEALLDKIVELVASGEKAEFYGFGNFEKKHRNARKGYNPKLLKELKEQGVSDEDAKAQAQIDIEASTVPGFKALKGFKTAVSGK